MSFELGSDGPQIPRPGVPMQTAVTQALASGAYRDGEVGALAALRPDVAQKPPRFHVFRPNLGEAFAQAVLARTLGAGRKPLVPSFGADARMIVEHCLEAQSLRRARDRRLTWVTLLCGVLFLPGAALWVLAAELQAVLGRGSGQARTSLAGMGYLVAALVTGYLLLAPPAAGAAGLYLRLTGLVPLVGWVAAKRTCLRGAEQLRARWAALVGGGTVGPKVPGAVPAGPHDERAQQLREGLDRIDKEQRTNILHYAGPRGIHGLGARWGEWKLAEELRPREGLAEFDTFHVSDLLDGPPERVVPRLRALTTSPVEGGGFPPPMSVEHWVVASIGEKADEIARPSPDLAGMDGVRMRASDIKKLIDSQRFGQSPRHYLGIQWAEWGGQLVLSLLCTITVLHRTLRVEVTGHALGPVAGLFTTAPAAREKTVNRPVKFWEQRTVRLPVVDNAEVVRLAVRAPLTLLPGPFQGLLPWLGGTLALPEPFGLRTAWATPAWGNRYMADDAIRSAKPVLDVIHEAVVEYLAEKDVDVSRFASRSGVLASEAQGARPGRPDLIEAD